MNLFDSILFFFIPNNKEEVIAIDKFTTCTIAFNISNFKQFSKSDLNKIVLFVSDTDYFELTFKIGENDELSLKTKNTNVFFQEIIKERELIEDEIVHFKLEIKKNNKQTINIYDFHSFISFWWRF